MPPEVSVIIPAYNADSFITDAIQSVLNQTCQAPTEIIVIDDASTDSTREKVRELTKQHSNIILLDNRRSKGPSGARNTGINHASGRFISFLDADDLWRENHLIEGVDFLLNQPEVDVVFFDVAMVDLVSNKEIGSWFDKRRFPKRLHVRQLCHGFLLILDGMFEALLQESFMHLQSMIIRRRTLNGIIFNEEVMRSEDRDFAIRLAVERRASFAYKNEITGIYHLHDQSLTSPSLSGAMRTTTDHIKLFESYRVRYALDGAQEKIVRRVLYRRYISAVYLNRQIRDYAKAWKMMLRSLKYGFGWRQMREVMKLVLPVTTEIWKRR